LAAKRHRLLFYTRFGIQNQIGKMRSSGLDDKLHSIVKTNLRQRLANFNTYIMKSFIFYFLGLQLLIVCLTVNITTGQTVIAYPLPTCYTLASQYNIDVNGTNIPIVDNTYGSTDIYNYAHFSFSGTMTITVTTSETISSYNISPLKDNISGTVNGNALSFTLNSSKYLILKINNLPDLVIAADNLETDVPPSSGPGIFNVRSSQYSADSTGGSTATTAIQQAIDDASGVGGGIVYIPAGVYKCASIVLKSNVSVYLAGGAVLLATGNPEDFSKFYYKSSVKMNGTYFIYTDTTHPTSNIKIFGRGTIDGNGYYMRTAKQWVNDLIVPLQTSYFTLDGIICRNSGLWAVIPTRSDHVVIKNTKHFNNNDKLYEDDGIDIQECQHVQLQHLIVISEDDAISTKTWTNYTDMAVSWPGSPELLDSVTADDCTTWSRCATFKIGFGSYQPQSNISVSNSTSYRSMRAIAINPAYGGNHNNSNIVFDNIDIEGFWPREGNQSKWLDVYTSHNGSAYGGPISDVEIKNINVRTFGSVASTIKGDDSLRQVNGVRLENVKVPGQPGYASSLSEMNIFDVNNFVNNITITPWDSLSNNLAINKDVQVSTTADSAYAGKYAVDGDNITKWWSVHSGYSQTFIVDLGRIVHNIQQVSIKWADGFAQKYQLQFSDDGSAWTTVDSVTANNYLLTQQEHLNTPARYIKMYGLGRGNGLGYTISEFEVKGDLYPPSNLPLPDYTSYGTAHYPERISFFKANPLKKGDIVFLGNSLTELAGDWGGRLGISHVDNRGIVSDHTYGVLARLNEIVYYKPSNIFLEIGINDLALSQYTAQYVADNISEIVKIIHSESPNTHIYVQTILPTTSTSLITKIKAANQMLMDKAATEAFTLIDLYPLFIDSNGLMKSIYTTDGTHLTEAGYQVWVNRLKELDLFSSTNISGNLAFHKPVYVSSVLNVDTTYGGDKAVDGIDSTTWWSNYAGYSQTFYVDLGRIFDIEKIVIKWAAEGGYAQAFNLQVSNDAQTWTTIYSVSGNMDRLNTIDGLTSSARYVRMLGLGRGNSLGYTISEFEVYQNSSVVLALPALNFEVRADSQAAYLCWNLPMKTNFDHFLVEKGISSKSFNSIGYIDNSVDLGDCEKFNFTDYNLIKGENFYRLKQVNKDGTYLYSDIKHLDHKVSTSSSKLKLYPNPAHRLLYLSIGNSDNIGGEKCIRIYNLAGSLIKYEKVNDSLFKIDVSKLSVGVYFLNLFVGKKLLSSGKFVKY